MPGAASSTPLCHLEFNGTIATITLADPASMNALGPRMVDDLHTQLNAAEAARALILTGQGGAFCSGANLREAAQLRTLGGHPGDWLASVFHPLLNRLRTYPAPIVVALNGVAAGIGASLALFGDLVVASKSANLQFGFRHIGLVPDGGAAFLLTKAIGRARALEVMMLGEPIAAEKAMDWGLINRVVEDTELMTVAHALAQNLGDGPRQALMATRKLTFAALEMDWAESMALEVTVQAQALASAEFAEGITAFLEKRRPRF